MQHVMEIEKPVQLTDFDFLTVNVIKITKQRCGKKGIVNELPSIFDFACGNSKLFMYQLIQDLSFRKH